MNKISLRNIRFAGCELKDNEIPMLINCVLDHETIQELGISGNKIKSKGLNALVKFLSSAHCKVTSLRVSFSDLLTSDVDSLLCTLWEGHMLGELLGRV